MMLSACKSDLQKVEKLIYIWNGINHSRNYELHISKLGNE